MMLFLAPLFIAGLFAGKAMRRQAAYNLYQHVYEAGLRYYANETHTRYIDIKHWDDVAKQYQFGVADFLSKEDYQTLKKYFVWEGED